MGNCLETNDPLTNLNSGLSTNLVLGLNSISDVDRQHSFLFRGSRTVWGRFGLAEVMTGFTHNFFGIFTSKAPAIQNDSRKALEEQKGLILHS